MPSEALSAVYIVGAGLVAALLGLHLCVHEKRSRNDQQEGDDAAAFGLSASTTKSVVSQSILDLFMNIVDSGNVCVVESDSIYDLPKGVVGNIAGYEYYGYFNIHNITYKLFIGRNSDPKSHSVRISDVSRDNSSLVLIRALKYLQMCDGPKKTQFLTDKDKLDFQLNEPYNYHAHLPGKEIRLKFIDTLSELYHMKPHLITNLKHLTRVCHNASLLIDDIEDDGRLRRGKSCAYLKYGVPLTINSAYYQMFACLAKIPILFDHSHDITTRYTIDSLLVLHQGQGCDILWRDYRICPTISEYISMIEKKTSEVFILITRLFFLHCSSYTYRLHTAATLASNFALRTSYLTIDQRIVNVARVYGVYFQIEDDYINITSEDFSKLKGLYDDIYERKYSFMVVYIISSRLDGYEELESIFSSPNKITEEQAKRCIELMRNTDAIAYTKNKLEELKSELRRNEDFDISQFLSMQNKN